jgi:hypothetical protein
VLRDNLCDVEELDAYAADVGQGIVQSRLDRLPTAEALCSSPRSSVAVPVPLLHALVHSTGGAGSVCVPYRGAAYETALHLQACLVQDTAYQSCSQYGSSTTSRLRGSWSGCFLTRSRRGELLAQHYTAAGCPHAIPTGKAGGRPQRSVTRKPSQH